MIGNYLLSERNGIIIFPLRIYAQPAYIIVSSA